MAALFGESAIARIERVIPGLMAEAGVPGLSMVLVEDAAPLWRGAFGVKEQGKVAAPGQLVDDRTVFEAASLSKPVFAYAVLKLCDDGLLELDTPLARYLPAPYSAYGLDPDEPRLQRVTARHVLSHSSGMGNWEDANIGRFSFAPGEQFLYSGEGYMYLQRVVEELTGRPLGPYMQERVLDPFDMIDSSYTWRDRYERQAARGHGGRDGGAGTRWPEAYAAYSLYSTPTDYARVLVELMRTVPGDADRLNQETLDRMLTPRTPIDDTLSWGLGWGVLRTDRGDYFWHWGDMRDYQHFTIASRARRHGLVVMTNSEHGLPVCRDIVAELMGLPFAHPLDTVLRLGW